MMRMTEFLDGSIHHKLRGERVNRGYEYLVSIKLMETPATAYVPQTYNPVQTCWYKTTMIKLYTQNSTHVTLKAKYFDFEQLKQNLHMANEWLFISSFWKKGEK